MDLTVHDTIEAYFVLYCKFKPIISLSKKKFFKRQGQKFSVVKFKGRTRRLLLLMSQLGFVVQRDNEWRALYAGRTVDVYVNSAIIYS